MAPPKKTKQIQSKENADSESDTLEDDKQKPEMDMGSIAQTLKQMNDWQTQQYKEVTTRLDRCDSTMQSVQEALIQLTESVDRQEATVNALHAKVFGLERDPVVEACAGFSSTARLRYPQTDANIDNNISRRNSMAIHPVSGESTSELGHHVNLRRDENSKHYHLDHLDRLSN